MTFFAQDIVEISCQHNIFFVLETLSEELCQVINGVLADIDFLRNFVRSLMKCLQHIG